MALHVLDEANRCLGCKKPMCQQGCPIHTNIPEVIRLLKAGKMDDAGWMLFENNPLTTVCSLVCDHEKQCEGHCVRNRMPSHDPVHFSVIENYISTTYANKMVAGPAPKNGMRAAIIGSGPAGLTIAVLLARWGYDITIFEARDKTGGVMRYGIPNYRLPDSVLDDFQYRHLELKGIKVRTNTEIGRTLTIDDLFRDGYKSIFIGAGLWKANAMHIKGESLGNAAFGIDYLANSKAFRLGDNIAVIGVGNSAMDCARTAIRNGARHVTCYARRDESCISASNYEVSYAKLEGVGFRFCKAPVEIRDDGLICRDTVKQADGSFVQVEGRGQREVLPPHRRHHLGQPGLGERPDPDHHRHRHQQEGPADRRPRRPHHPSRRLCGRRRGQGRAHRGRGGGHGQGRRGGHGRVHEEPAQGRHPRSLRLHPHLRDPHLGRLRRAGAESLMPLSGTGR